MAARTQLRYAATGAPCSLLHGCAVRAIRLGPGELATVIRATDLGTPAGRGRVAECAEPSTTCWADQGRIAVQSEVSQLVTMR